MVEIGLEISVKKFHVLHQLRIYYPNFTRVYQFFHLILYATVQYTSYTFTELFGWRHESCHLLLKGCYLLQRLTRSNQF